MITRRLALLGAGLLLATPAGAQEPVLGSVAITWDEILALPTGSGGRARQLMRLPTATLDELRCTSRGSRPARRPTRRTPTRTKKSS